MSDKENFEALKPKYLLIEQDDIKDPNMPVKIFNDEAVFLFDIASEDKDQLVTSGLDISLIDDIPNRVSALRYSQSIWNKVLDNKSEKENQWKAIAAEGFELKEEIMHFAKYAYRENESIMRALKRIEEGASNADMIQDLSDLAVIGKDDPTPMDGVGFNTTKLDRAEQIATEGGLLLGDINGDRRNVIHPEKEMRDRAYTYLKQAIDTIRDAGKFVFWKNQKRAEQYASSYMREMRNRSEQEETQNA
ncbi:hypothetical protein [Marinifilum fragile]|uniref:hypothetical protein n=1 Tax=Marinifilum fragile TaxID=570161 RepID=UPI002AA78FDA|nr:hypothetical protein [Marinifilum fragile]